MRIRLKEELPPPGAGMWDLEVEDFPDCPAVSKTDVGGGHEFLIPFAERVLCGVDAEYVMVRFLSFFTSLLTRDAWRRIGRQKIEGTGEQRERGGKGVSEREERCKVGVV